MLSLLTPCLLLTTLSPHPLLTSAYPHHPPILAIGSTPSRLIVIAGPRAFTSGYPLLYNLSLSSLSPTKGQLYLKGTWPLPLSDKYPIQSTASQLWSQPIDHAITYWDAATGRLFFMTQTRMPDNSSAQLYFDLSTNALRPPYPRNVGHYDDVWISSSEPLTFYLIKDAYSRQKAPGGALALGDAGSPGRQTQIAKATAGNVLRPPPQQMRMFFTYFKLATPYLTICKVTPDPGNRTIYLSGNGNCPHPVTWQISSGFVDQQTVILVGDQTVRYFDRRLLEMAPSESVKGVYGERSFDDFFFKDHPIPRKGNSSSKGLFPKWALIPIVVAIVALICVVLFIVYCFCDCCPEKKSALESSSGAMGKGEAPAKGVSTETSTSVREKASPPKKKKAKKSKTKKKPVTPKKKDHSPKSKKTEKSKARKASSRTQGPSRKTKKTRKTKKSDKKSQRSKKKAKKGSDLLPPHLSNAMASLKTNVDGDEPGAKASGTSKARKASQRTAKSKSRSAKGKKSVKTGQTGAAPPQQPLLGKLGAGKLGVKAPSPGLKIAGKMLKSLKYQAPSGKAGGKSKKTKMAPSLKGAPAPNDGASFKTGLAREKTEGTMRAGSEG